MRLIKIEPKDINHLITSITSDGIEAAIESPKKKKSSAPDKITAKFYQTFKEYQHFSNFSMK
jgi:hypothetical protein